MKTWLAATAVVAASLAVVPAARADTTVTATVDHWADGDTVVTDLGTVRLIGVNAPDVAECGYTKATRIAEALAPEGSNLTLTLPASHDNTDAYGRYAIRVPDGDWTVKVTMPSGRVYDVYQLTVSGDQITDDRGEAVASLTITR